MSKKIRLINDPALSINLLQVAEKAQKENKNLDLRHYEPFMTEFQRMGLDLFEGNNIFEERKNKIKDRLLDKGISSTERSPDAKALSKKELDDFKRKMPPNQNDSDVLQLEEISQFQQFGPAGWQYFKKQLFNTNPALYAYIRYLRRLRTLEELVESRIKNKTAAAKRCEALPR